MTEALKRSTISIDAIYETAAQHHNAIETGAVAAAWDEDGTLSVQAPVQWTGWRGRRSARFSDEA